MRYAIFEELIEGYVKIILESERDKDCPRWGTCKEKVREVETQLHSKEIKERVYKKIDTIMKKA